MDIKSLTENTIVNRKRTKRQTMIHKTTGRQKRMKNTNPTKYWGRTQVLRKVRQNIDSSSRLYNGNLIGTTSIRKIVTTQYAGAAGMLLHIVFSVADFCLINNQINHGKNKLPF